MKCQYCGKELRERQRFCDNCGRTVRHINESSKRTTSQRRPSSTSTSNKTRTSTAAKRTTGNNDSFNRYDKYRREQQRKAQEMKKRKMRNRRLIVFILLLAICVGIIGFIVAFNKTKEAGISKINAPEENIEEPLVSQIPSAMDGMDFEDVSNPDATAAAAASSSPNPSSSASPNPSASPSASASSTVSTGESDKYMVYKETVSGISCPYPADFSKSDVSSETTKITVTDGEAQMRINTEKTSTQDTAQSLLKSYSSGLGVEASQSSSDKNIYSVSFTRNGKYNHRTGVISNGRHVYYDFSCSSEYADKSEYKEIIKYIDDSLQSQIDKLNSAN